MTLQNALVIIAIIGGLGGTGVLGWYFGWRRDRREQRSAEAQAAERTIELLQEQIVQLKVLREEARTERARREEEWREREAKLEARIAGLEQSYRDLVANIVGMGMCKKAPKCDSYDPGDGRFGPTATRI